MAATTTTIRETTATLFIVPFILTSSHLDLQKLRGLDCKIILDQVANHNMHTLKRVGNQGEICLPKSPYNIVNYEKNFAKANFPSLFFCNTEHILILDIL